MTRMRGWKAVSRAAWFILPTMALLLVWFSGLNGGKLRATFDYTAEDMPRRKWISSRGFYDFASKELLKNWNCSVSQFQKVLESYEVLESLHHCQRIFYNRVPKCGSRTLLTLFKTLSSKHSYNVTVAPKTSLNQEREIDFVRNFTQLNPPYLFSGHIPFVNFSSFNIPPPIYINVIRDPVERLISHYYYNQYGSNNSPLLAPKLNFEMSLDECVSSGRGSCFGQILSIIPYFCGLNDHCRSKARPEDRLAQVKRTVREFYLVVGITEDLPAFVELLEKLLPQFFSNATNQFLEMEALLQNKTRTYLKPTVKEETRKILKNAYALDYEFYEFARQRFYALLDKVRSVRRETKVKLNKTKIQKAGTPYTTNPEKKDS